MEIFSHHYKLFTTQGRAWMLELHTQHLIKVIAHNCKSFYCSQETVKFETLHSDKNFIDIPRYASLLLWASYFKIDFSVTRTITHTKTAVWSHTLRLHMWTILNSLILMLLCLLCWLVSFMLSASTCLTAHSQLPLKSLDVVSLQQWSSCFLLMENSEWSNRDTKCYPSPLLQLLIGKCWLRLSCKERANSLRGLT